MAWNDNMTVMLRNVINDAVSPTTYSDDRLKELLVNAAVFVVFEVDFAYTYVINVMLETIVPDPVALGDQDFQVLVVYKAAAMFAHGEYKVAAQKSIQIKDGPSLMDFRESGLRMRMWAKELLDKYDKAVVNYKTGDGARGEAIVGPYNLGV